ncbi:transposase family protein [Streptomyces sp. GESEQ-35]|uniref:transposase family protein n=1 Tax=Streptomyces sp. GESEQ-35 TaxID=2812657 RepID=UPI0027E28E38|nr:transposase family protein [Streptomyces sp. GESEQ-35]
MAGTAGREDRDHRAGRALKKIARRGGEVVLIDGTLIPTQRRTGTANRPNYSGKHHRHGLHVLALTDERGRMIWISAARPGRTHDVTAARRDRILSHLRAAGLGALADLGFLDLDDDPDDPVVVTGFKAPPRPGRARLRPSQDPGPPPNTSMTTPNDPHATTLTSYFKRAQLH